MIKTSQTIRPEFNLTKYSDFIFPHPRTKGLNEVRSMSWQKDGTDCQIEIAPNIKSDAPSSKTYKILLAIFIHIQLEKIDPLGGIPISLRRIATILGKKWGGRVAKEICLELTSLQVTNLEWTESFQQKNKKRAATITQMSILNKAKYKAKNISKGEYFKGVESITLKFDEDVAKNIKDNYCIPINFKVYQSLNNKPYVQILYLKIGLYLASNKYRSQQFSALKILEILHIKTNRYFDKAKGKNNRKAFLNEVRQLLDKQPLAANYTLNISVSKTVDESDYKLIISANKVEVKPKHQLVIINKDDQLVLKLCHDIRMALNLNYEMLTAENKAFIRHYCEVYPKNIIELAITTYKERSAWKIEQNEVINNKFAYFASCMHHQAHDSNMNWIKDCGDDCKYKLKVINNV